MGELLFMGSIVFLTLITKLPDWTNMLQSTSSLLTAVTTLVLFPVFSMLLIVYPYFALFYIFYLVISVISYVKSKSLEKQTLTAILDQVNNQNNYIIVCNEHLKHIDYGWSVFPDQIIEKFKKNGSIPNSVTFI